MDDVDQIVLSSLKEIGFDVNSETANLRACSLEELVSMVFYCLNTIQPDKKFPVKLPPAMNSRFAICTDVANICKELGFKGDIGYHTFLYNNRSDIRNVLIFLNEHLPRKDSYPETEKSENKSNITIKHKTAEKLRQLYSSKSKDPYGFCNRPFISVKLETGTLLPTQKIDCKPLEWRDFVIQKLPFIDEQIPDYQYFFPSLISLNSQGLLNPSKTKCSQFNYKPLDDSFFKTGSSQSLSTLACRPLSCELPESVDPINITNSSGDVEGEAENTRTVLESEKIDLKERISALSLKLNDIKRNNQTLISTLEEKKSRESALQKSIALLPDSENNIPKLLLANESCRNKIQRLESEWKKHKDLLLDRRNELKIIIDEKLNEKNKITQNIIEVRKELFKVIELIEEKDSIEQKLNASDVLSKGVQRSEYIQRILEIVKNIKKQDVEIEKILSDTREVQKEINSISGKIERQFTVAEQMILSNPGPNDFSKETHQLLLQIHSHISDVINIIGESGQLSREIKDHEEHLLECNKDVTESLEQVTNDLQKIKDKQNLYLKEIELINAGVNVGASTSHHELMSAGVNVGASTSHHKPKKRTTVTTIQVQAVIEQCENDFSHPLAS